MVKAIVSLSGGMDSTTILAKALLQCDEVRTIGFTYGSKHNQYENAAAVKIAHCYNIPFTLIDLSTVMVHFKSDLLKSGGEIPEGHYESKTMERTVVPARNMIFASILAGIAASFDYTQIWMGVHAGDHAIYPDCRIEFIEQLENAIQLATDKRIDVVAPFYNGTKKNILEYGLSMKFPVPYHLTRTCYKDQVVACGKCGSCQERLAAFRDVGIDDPIEYESRVILSK